MVRKKGGGGGEDVKEGLDEGIMGDRYQQGAF